MEGPRTGKGVALALNTVEKAGAPYRLVQQPLNNGVIATARHADHAEFKLVGVEVARLFIGGLRTAGGGRASPHLHPLVKGSGCRRANVSSHKISYLSVVEKTSNDEPYTIIARNFCQIL
jgi:hypothetical protein